MAARVECIFPILSVRSIRESIRFYCEMLGFKANWGGEHDATMASIERDGQGFMLCQGEQGQPGTWLWIGVDDIRPLHAELVEKGAKVVLPPTRFYWAYEFRIEDPDGHILRFGSDPLPG
jgi:predicted enzyme related to lactoylglutathione lyase